MVKHTETMHLLGCRSEQYSLPMAAAEKKMGGQTDKQFNSASTLRRRLETCTFLKTNVTLNTVVI